MWTSQARTSPENSDCQSSSMISRRLKTWPGRSASSHGPGTRAGQVDRLAADGDQVAGEIDRDLAGLDRARAALDGRGAVELAAAELGADAAEQLADAERLGDVVVGADLEADDLVDLGVLRGQEDDRSGCGRERPGRGRGRFGQHHDVEDQEVERDLAVAELVAGIVAVGREDDREALLLERVANRLADRRLVVGHEDPSTAHIDLIIRSLHCQDGGSGSLCSRYRRRGRSAARSTTRKVLPALLGVDADLAAHHVDHPLRDRRPRPKPSRSSEPLPR